MQFHNLQALQGSINMPNELETQLKLKLDQLNQYSIRRKLEYGILSSQLDLLYNDIRDGYFGENAKEGSWYKKITEIKSNYPKPDIVALKVEIEELIKQVDVAKMYRPEE